VAGDIERVPARFRPDIVRRIGHGGEAVVYELTGGRVLRVFHGKPHGADGIAAFYRAMSAGSPSFLLPEVLEQGEDNGVAYVVQRLIPGRPLHELMTILTGNERKRALTSYTYAAFEIASLPYARDSYGEFLRDDDSIQAETWTEYLLARMRRSLDASPWLRTDVPTLDHTVHALAKRINAMQPAPKSLVHGDYFPGNVLMDSAFEVSGVIDFGPLTVIGDPALDLASAAIFLEVVRPGYLPEDSELVTRLLVDRAGPAIQDTIITYRAWYAIRFAPYRDDDPNLYAWCTSSLRLSP
jgi:hypothetical protein